MPHMLRRVIAINIRNPASGAPSGRIAQLDPRDGVLAVGENGVGKTTFLRLIPLFYGAAPSQVLKGSGRSSMIRYTLPDATSAVAYEYERESETDLRTVVMHAKEGEDTPEFRIVYGGFDEAYFFDEKNQFIDSKQFKARVEALGIEITPRLLLNQYRAVILNERPNTKDGPALRKLAARYSLGPKILSNLDQIAAAMANERINFRDLQNIVLERVTDSETSTSKSVNTRELKKNKNAVKEWIEARDHLVDIFKRKPDAQRMQTQVENIKAVHHELCSLHVSAKSLLIGSKSQLHQLHVQRADHQRQLQTAEKNINGQTALAENYKKKASAEYAAMRDQVFAVEQKQKNFSNIDAPALAKLQDAEGSFKEQLAAKEKEHKCLLSESDGIDSRFKEQQHSIEQSASEQIREIDERYQAYLLAVPDRLNWLDSERGKALQLLSAPPRIQAIRSEVSQIDIQLGGVEQKLRTPVASEKTRTAWKDAQAQVRVLREAATTTQKQAEVARQTVSAVGKSLDAALQRVKEHEGRQSACAARLHKLRADMTPPQGSLLEFIRASDPGLWEQAAKVISPELLKRTDMDPVLEDESDPGAFSGCVVIGPVSLQVQGAPQPSWLDMRALSEEIERVERQELQLAQELADAQSHAKTVGRQYQSDEENQAAALAKASLAQSSWETANHSVEQLAARIHQEEADAVETARTELRTLQLRAAALKNEEQAIRSVMAADRKAIEEDFIKQRQSLEAQDQEAKKRFAQEKEGTAERKAAAIARLEEYHKRELAGLGLDPVSEAKLRHEITVLAAQLQSIAKHRHEVEAWRIFCSTELPSLESHRRERDRLQQIATDAERAVMACMRAMESQRARGAEELAVMERDVQNAKADVARMETLLDKRLKGFLDHAVQETQGAWNVQDFEEGVQKRLRTLDELTDALEKDTRSLRNELIKHPGAPADWLTSKEAELPDGQTSMDHEYQCAKAQMVYAWFDVSESGPHIDQLAKTMQSFFSSAAEFARSLKRFDSNVNRFNSQLGKALATAKHFERFKDLSVKVTSSVGQLAYLKVLTQMENKADLNSMAYVTAMRSEQDIPSNEDTALVRQFRDILQSDGDFKVNLSEQLQLQCSLVENGRPRTITNEEEFRSISSNGNSALITAMFLMGFVQMIRGDAPVRLVWITDEIARFDAGNVAAFLQTLAHNRIDVISACPSLDPAIARHFTRLSLFGGNGAIYTTEQNMEGAANVQY